MIAAMRIFATLGLAALLVACDQSSPAAPNISMTMPRVISDVREVDKDNVSPLVLLNGNTEIPMQEADGREGFTGSISVTPNTEYDLSVIWREFFPDRNEYLELARVDKRIFVGEGTTTENIGNNEYRTDMDLDGDGVSNLQERINNTNPFPDNNAGGDTDGDTPNDPGTDANGTDGSSTDTGTTDSGSTTGTSTGSDGSSDGATTNSTDGGVTTSATDGTSQGTDGDATTGSDGTGTGGSTTDGSSDGGATDNGTDAGSSDGGATDNDTDTGSGDGGSTDNGTDGSSDGGSTDNGTDGGSESATVIIPRISSSDAPLIDGEGLGFLGSNGELVGEWASAVQFDINGAPLVIENLMIDSDAEAPNSDGIAYRRWAAMHDGDRLYILVLVDDDGNRQSDSSLGYQDDSLELFIDGDNSKLTEYDDNDDFQFWIPMLQLNTSDANNSEDGRFSRGQFSSTESLDLRFYTGPGIGPDGIRRERYEQDVYELSFDISAAGIVPGLEFGLELQVNDDDDGGDRDGKWGWFHPARGSVDTDETWMNPSIMGTVVLEQ